MTVLSPKARRFGARTYWSKQGLSRINLSMGNFKLMEDGTHRIKVCKSFDEPMPGPWRKPGKPAGIVGIKERSAWGLGPK